MNPREVPPGWIPDTPDHRDHRYTERVRTESLRLPPIIDLRRNAGRVENQGRIGSCVAHAVTSALEYLDAVHRNIRDRQYSRLFVYYNGRTFKDRDTGVAIRDTFKSLARDGACLEPLWPYDITQWPVKPPDTAYRDAKLRQAVEYLRLDPGLPVRRALADGFPVTFGFTVYDSFYRTPTGPGAVVPMPDGAARSAHSMLLLGYDTPRSLYLARNSWGPDWGDRGDCWFHFGNLDNPTLATDFWVVRKIEDGTPDPPPIPRKPKRCPWLTNPRAARRRRKQSRIRR